jgi:hypothetical protein
MKLQSSTILSAAIGSTVPFLLMSSMTTREVQGHGHVIAPMSRNYYATKESRWGNPDVEAGIPLYQNTPQGLNQNTGICGKDQTGILDYDQWLDTQGNHMPWISQAEYEIGEDIVLDIKITAHHRGHFSVKACPLGNDSTQECLDTYPLTFVEDVYYGMPKDDNYPVRAYLKENQNDYRMVYKLPDSLAGTEVVLQWVYWTANSCNLNGYHDYFDAHPEVKSAANLGLATCATDEGSYQLNPLPNGAIPLPAPEVFINCMEVTIHGEPSPTPPFAPPSPRPPTEPPVATPVAQPELPPVDPGVTGTCGGGSVGNGICVDHSLCCSEWGHCGTQASGHCENLAPITDGGGDGGDNGGNAPPVPVPVASPVSMPTGKGDGNNNGNGNGEYECVARSQDELPPGQWATVDENCARCANGYEWWPCDTNNIYLCNCGVGVGNMGRR